MKKLLFHFKSLKFKLREKQIIILTLLEIGFYQFLKIWRPPQQFANPPFFFLSERAQMYYSRGKGVPSAYVWPQVAIPGKLFHSDLWPKRFWHLYGHRSGGQLQPNDSGSWMATSD